MTFEIGPRPYADPDVARLVAEVQAHYVEIYGSPDEAAVDDGEFVLPRGVMLVGSIDGEVVAMGGWRRMANAASPTAEIKRMYVTPRRQRQGLARRMLAAVEQSAAAAGIENLVLNTGPHQQPAIALYVAEGYTPWPPFGHYAEHGDALFFAKQLRGTT